MAMPKWCFFVPGRCVQQHQGGSIKCFPNLINWQDVWLGKQEPTCYSLWASLESCCSSQMARIETPSYTWQVPMPCLGAIPPPNSIHAGLFCSNTVLPSLSSSPLISMLLPCWVVFFAFKETSCYSMAEWFRHKSLSQKYQRSLTSESLFLLLLLPSASDSACSGHRPPAQAQLSSLLLCCLSLL